MSRTITSASSRDDLGPGWDTPAWHPHARTGSGLEHLVPVPATIREPLCIGLNPGTGVPLKLPLFDDLGGKVVVISAKKAAGLTTLLDDVNERITACPDARLIQISLSRTCGVRRWEPLAAAAAYGPAAGRAGQILRFAEAAIGERSRGRGRLARVHQPTPGEPLYVLEIEGTRELTEANPEAAGLLEWITRMCRLQGWAVILAGPRSLDAAAGGAAIVSSTGVAVLGQSTRPSGQGPGGPVTCGAGVPGLFGVYTLPFDGTCQRGRAFWWGGDGDLVAPVVAARLATQPAHELEPALASLQDRWDQIRAGA
jgi:hypothetical protein